MPEITADKLTKEQESQALQSIQDNKIKQASTAEYIQDVKQSMLFRPGFSWSDLLSAAPVSVSLLGSLFVASTIPDAWHIKIIPPSGGFKYFANFDKPSLNACLVQCSDQGVKAFGKSATCFQFIALESHTIKKTINDIVRLLGDPEAAQTLLVPTVGTLISVAKKCESKAREMETVFQAWLDMICELHACVVQTSSDASEKQAANQLHLAAAKAKLASTDEAKKLATESVSTLKSSLETATSAYKKAADEFPSGWDLVAQEFVTNLSESFTNAINLAVPALIENFSLTAKVQMGVNMFKGDNGGAKGGSVRDGAADHSNVVAATNAPPVVPTATPPFPNDPAYGVIGHIRAHVLSIQSFITGGPDKGVDWKLLRSKDPEKQNNGLAVLAVLLDDANESFKPSPDLPSQTLLDIFSKVKKVTDALQKAIESNSSINGAPLPKADSPEVKEWQLSMAVEVAKAIQLDTDSKHLTSPLAPPMVNTPQANSSPTGKGGAFRKQVIDAATTKLDQTAKVMQTFTENYQKASDKLVDVQLKIGEIQAELASLQADNIDLDKIKAILIKCIDILVQLKSQISRLVAFFSAVSTLVEHVVESQVTPFIDYLKASTGIDKTERTILNFSFTDFQRQMIFGFSLNVRAYFELFRDIADMYGDVNTKFIGPGLEIVNSMQSAYGASNDPAEQQKILQDRTAKMAAFNLASTKGVKELVDARQAEISADMQKNAQTTANQLELVPVRASATVTKAITDSTDAAKKAAAKGINESGKYLARKFTDTSSLIDNS